MKKNEYVKKKNTTKMLVIIFIVLVIVNLAGILFILKDKDNENNGSANNDISNQNKIEEVSSFEIETKYCKLYFPEIWKKQIEVKFSEDLGYKTEFYALIENKESKHIFDVCFNSDNGFLLGYLEKNDEIINISIDVMDLTFDDSWTQEEMNEIYSMQEEVNYVIESLKKIDYYVEP